MTATANPTTSEFYDNLQLTDQRVSQAAQEVLLRLETNMPTMVAYLNGTLNYSDPHGIQVPKDYMLAPAMIEDKHINTVLLSLATDYQALGPGAFKSSHTVSIFSIEPASRTDTQVVRAFERASCIRGILRAFMNGCRNDDDVMCWSQLIPVSMTPLPNDWEVGFFGTTNTFRMTINPSENNWT